MARGFDRLIAPALDIPPLNRITAQAAPGDLYPQTLCLLLGGFAHEAIAISRAQIRSNLLPDIFIETQDTAGAIAAAANKILVEAYPMYCGKAFMTLVGTEITVREPTELEVKEWERSNAATGMLHIVLPKPKQRQAGEAIKVRMGRDSLGRYFWFEEPPLFYGKNLPPGTEVYGPFATEAECEESQRLVLLGPQCEVEHGGTWDPAWDRMQ